MVFDQSQICMHEIVMFLQTLVAKIVKGTHIHGNVQREHKCNHQCSKIKLEEGNKTETIDNGIRGKSKRNEKPP